MAETEGNWQKVRLGFYLQLMGIAAFAIPFILASFFSADQPFLFWCSAPFAVAAPILIFAGPLFCLHVPPQTGLRNFVLGAIVLQFASLFLTLSEIGEFTTKLSLFLFATSVLVFLLFVVGVARFLQQSALRIVGVVLILGLVAMLGFLGYVEFIDTELKSQVLAGRGRMIVGAFAILVGVAYAWALFRVAKCLPNPSLIGDENGVSRAGP